MRHRHRERAAICAIIVILIALTPEASHADVPSLVTLDTSFDEATVERCPSAEAVRVRLDAYLAESETLLATQATVRVTVARSGGFVATISLARGDLRSEREVAGSACVQVLEAAVLIIAIAVDPAVSERAPPAASVLVAPIEEPEMLLADPRAPPQIVERVPAGPEAPALLLRAGGALTFSIVPEPAFGAVVEVGARISFLEVALGFLWASETGRVFEGGRGGSFGFYVGTLRFGVALTWDALELVPRARLGIGAMTGRGVGVARTFFEASEWVEVAGGFEVRWRAELGTVDVAPFASLELMIPFVRPTFVLNAADAVFTPGEVGGSISVGLMLFWTEDRPRNFE